MPGQRHELHHKICNLRYGTPGYGMSVYEITAKFKRFLLYKSHCSKAIQKWIAFLLYRKFLKSLEIVYNRLEIKNDITKERRGLRHDVVYEVFCFGLG